MNSVISNPDQFLYILWTQDRRITFIDQQFVFPPSKKGDTFTNKSLQ